MKHKFTQKEIWQMVLSIFRDWIGYHHRIVFRIALEEALDLIQDDNNIQIPIEWRWKFRKRINKPKFTPYDAEYYIKKAESKHNNLLSMVYQMKEK